MLTYLEQQNILNGTIKLPDISISDLMALIAVDYALYFRENVKTIPEDVIDDSIPESPVVVTSYSNARQYKSQMLGVCNRVLCASGQQLGGLLSSFTRVFVGLVGQSPVTYEMLEQFGQAEWESIKDGIPNVPGSYNGIKKLFENIAGTTIEGKAEYDNI